MNFQAQNMPQADYQDANEWLCHSLTLIVYANEADDAHKILDNSARDAQIRLIASEEHEMDSLPSKRMFCSDFRSSLSSAMAFMQDLAIRAKKLPVVLIRLDTLGKVSLVANPSPLVPSDEGHFNS
jgi:hypothetical protein